MPVYNADVANIFNQVADLLEIEGANEFRVRAYRNAARQRGYEYLAVTDHSSYIGVTQGLDAEELTERVEEIERLDEEMEDFGLLKGIEVDILEDGSLDLPDDVLEKLDLVVCSIHSKFDLSREKQTERIIRAMDNPHVHILGHPTGRRINDRPPYEIDLERVMEAALERGCFLELNAQPDRLDLKDTHCQMAKEMGLKVAISTAAEFSAGLYALRRRSGPPRLADAGRCDQHAKLASAEGTSATVTRDTA
jgi:DNA polymerase (family 10)